MTADMKLLPVRVTEIIHALEREAGNTDTDPRWLAASELRRMQGWERRTLVCEVDVQLVGADPRGKAGHANEGNAMTARAPVEVFPVTEYIADEMIARGWTTADVVLRMEPADFMSTLIAFDLMMAVYAMEAVIIDDETFAGLARAFDTSETLWRNLDAAWKAHPDKRSQPLFEPPDAIWPDPPLYRLNVPDNDDSGVTT